MERSLCCKAARVVLDTRKPRVETFRRMQEGFAHRAMREPSHFNRGGGTMFTRFSAAVLAASIAFALPLSAAAQKTLKIGFPMILSGPGALFGEPTVQGAQMLVDEVNAKGGVAGRKLQLVVRDTKGNADEAVRVTRELILKENGDFVVEIGRAS